MRRGSRETVGVTPYPGSFVGRLRARSAARRALAGGLARHG